MVPGPWPWVQENNALEPDPQGDVYLVAEWSGGRVGSGARPLFLVQSRETVRVLGVDGHVFWLVDDNSQVLNVWGPDLVSDCEIGYYSHYEMWGGNLLRFTAISNDTSDRLARYRVEEILYASHRLQRDDPRLAWLQG